MAVQLDDYMSDKESRFESALRTERGRLVAGGTAPWRSADGQRVERAGLSHGQRDS